MRHFIKSFIYYLLLGFCVGVLGLVISDTIETIREEQHKPPAHTPRQATPPDCAHLYDVGRHCAWAACMLIPCRPGKAKPTTAMSDAVLAEMWRTDI